LKEKKREKELITMNKRNENVKRGLDKQQKNKKDNSENKKKLLNKQELLSKNKTNLKLTCNNKIQDKMQFKVKVKDKRG
jgi:hypothetical protein